MGCARGVNYQRFHISNVRKQRENAEIIDEFLRGFIVALDFKGENRTAAVREVLLVQLVARLGFKRRVVNSLNLRVIVEILNDFQRVLNVTFNTKRQRFQSL